MAASTARVLFHGCGNAGQAITDAVCRKWSAHPRLPYPGICLTDGAAWKPHHARGGLVSAEELGVAKVETTRQRLIGGGWSPQRVQGEQVDVRDCPRAMYEGSLVLALTDSHELKAHSVEYALSVGSPAVAVGLGPEAVVEQFAGDGAHYCCVHHSDDYSRRRPCMPEAGGVSTTTTANRSVVRATAALVADLIEGYVVTGVLAGDEGVRVVSAERNEPFRFRRDPHCLGVHDRPADDRSTMELSASPDQIGLDDLLAALKPGGRYDDRPLAWAWRCRTCAVERHLLHTVHPGAECPACGMRMEPGWERASGLGIDELRELAGHRGRLPSLAAMGLGRERLFRCIAGDDRVWVRLRGE